MVVIRGQGRDCLRVSGAERFRAITVDVLGRRTATMLPERCARTLATRGV